MVAFERPLAEQVEGGQADRRRQAGGHADRIQPGTTPENLGHEREPDERQTERQPDPSAHGLALHDPRGNGDHQRPGELEEEGDADR